MHQQLGFHEHNHNQVPSSQGRPKGPQSNGNIRVRNLLTIFKPTFPDQVLPRDPRPNYVPLYLDKECRLNPNIFICPSCRKSYESKTHLARHRRYRHGFDCSNQIVRKGSKSTMEIADCDSQDVLNGEGSTSNTYNTGAKCPHCDSVLAYAYNLTKHIEVCYCIFYFVFGYPDFLL